MSHTRIRFEDIAQGAKFGHHAGGLDMDLPLLKTDRLWQFNIRNSRGAYIFKGYANDNQKVSIHHIGAEVTRWSKSPGTDYIEQRLRRIIRRNDGITWWSPMAFPVSGMNRYFNTNPVVWDGDEVTLELTDQHGNELDIFIEESLHIGPKDHVIFVFKGKGQSRVLQVSYDLGN